MKECIHREDGDGGSSNRETQKTTEGGKKNKKQNKALGRLPYCYKTCRTYQKTDKVPPAKRRKSVLDKRGLESGQSPINLYSKLRRT